MSITTETTSTTKHRATLAGGINVTIEPAVFGYVLTLGDGEPRSLCLPVDPKQMEEIAHGAPVLMWPRSFRILTALTWFIESARELIPTFSDEECEPSDDDYATLRSLAVAVLAKEAQS